jgi:putative transposase
VTFGATTRSVFTPALTLWAFLSQVVSKGKSCRDALLRVVALLIALHREPCSLDTAAYCRARAKLPTTVIRRLTTGAGQRMEQQAPKEWLWHGRHVKLVDGTTVTLPDTQANQQAFPQFPTQKPGLGFPLMRVVAILSLATASLLDMATGPWQGKETGETALLRQLLDGLEPGDILLADCFYCSYWLVAMALARGLDVVFRIHARRDYDFRRGQHLGPGDHVVQWHKPPRLDWMDKATYEALPETLTVREIRVVVTTPGSRAEELVIATTLIHAADYSKEAIGDLYHERWQVELDIRSIKQSLHMEYLRCKTPDMAEKEMWVHFLAYNLIRKVAAQAASTQGNHPREMSFTASQGAIDSAWNQLTRASIAERWWQGQHLLRTLGKEKVGDRPDRYEPRAVKRRPKEYPRLTKPRAQARAELLRGKRQTK